jgi:hypothetical protein
LVPDFVVGDSHDEVKQTAFFGSVALRLLDNGENGVGFGVGYYVIGYGEVAAA